MFSRIVALFTLCLLTLSVEGQQVQKVNKPIALEDPGIPGIRLISADSPEFAQLPEAKLAGDKLSGTYAVKNETGKRIIGMGVSGTGRQYYTSEARPMMGFIGVAPGESAIVKPVNLILPHDGAMGFAGEPAGVNARYFLQYIVLEDGTFYGYTDDFEEFSEELQYRQDFAKAATAAPDFHGFMKQQQAEPFDRSRAEKSRAAGRAIGHVVNVMGALYEYDPTRNASTNREAFIQRHLMITRQKPFRHIKLPYYQTEKEAQAAAPKNVQDRWHIDKIEGYCYLGNKSQTQYDYITFDQFDVGLLQYCSFPQGTNGMSPTISASYGNQILSGTGTYGWNFNAACYQGDIQATDDLKLTYPFDSFSDGESYDTPTTSEQSYLPPARLFYRLNTNRNVYPDFYDTVYAARVVGILRPTNPYAPATTKCYVSWFDPASILYNQANKIPFPKWPTLVSSVYLSEMNTHLWDQTAPNDYGYLVYNYLTTYVCGGVANTPARPDQLIRKRMTKFDTSRPTTPVDNVTANEPNTAVTWCTHPPLTAQNSDCDLMHECCCCMATYGDWLFCQLACDPTLPPSCDTIGEAITYETSQGKTVPQDAAAIPPVVVSTAGNVDQIGVFRRDPTHPQFLADWLGHHATDTTTKTAYFAPPGGVQAGDIPVAGDWTGFGSASPGYYRPSTGQWFLDADHNGIWSAGDYQYTFGGVQPSGGVPGDVPVVGDWAGMGQSCIGVFRWGSTWVLDANCNGRWDGSAYGADSQFNFGGMPGDVPVVGRWFPGITDPSTGTSYPQLQSRVGVVRCYAPSGSCQGYPFYWVLDSGGANDPNQTDHIVGLGSGCGYQPAQAWYLAQCQTPAPFAFGGLAGDVFVTGDWTGGGNALPGVYRQGEWVLDAGDHVNINVYWFGGLAIDTPVPAKW